MGSPSASFLVRHEFLIRRLHSLSGLIPVGAFLVLHLLTNASVLGGADFFQDNVDRIHTLRGAALVAVEWAFIFLPLLFHAVIGVVIIRGGLPNSSTYTFPRNLRYTAQRITGMVAMAFILYHVWHMHALGAPLGGGNFEPERATSTAALALQAGLWKTILYAVGILASVFHLANGLWTMGITWGVWISPAAQRRADYVCAAVGVLLAAAGLSALGRLTTLSEADLRAAQAIEQARIEQREALRRRVEQLLEGEPAAGTAAGREALAGGAK